MVRKLGFATLWLGFVLYAFWLAPPAQPDTWVLIQQLSSGDWAGINPLVVALFNLMGIWPLIYGAVLFVDGTGQQRLPAWPFAIGSFAVGAFALLPYLALRDTHPTCTGAQSLFLKIWDSRALGIALLLGSSALIIYGLGGDGSDLIQQWQTSRFIHVMSLDFCLLSLLFPALLGDDMSRRDMPRFPWFWVALIPLIGPLLYLSVRPRLPESLPALEATVLSDQVGQK
ncbi:DUF2834 domain-containing protein [Synechococcales cyanobacterium C]|uniref:DUF2834 domain-containing protein n=1 Tax=Petrachloros mirabilis ULC683 TaxID=2781853 RepID=A0A8K1ZY01_9CYAN|nr:DUF2834 domain-containing protein [Petrachloros mirabilis]NCJ06178.1 DUF2834 domain-containing protein [Petrachloros mirabilis ULC683]